MSSSTDPSPDDSIDHQRLINGLAMREVRRGLINLDHEEDGDLSREEVLSLLNNNPDASQLCREIVSGAKERILEDSHIKLGSIEDAGQGPTVIRDSLNLRQVCYYDSYFRFADRTTRAYKIPELGGVLQDIAENGESASEARDRFLNYCESTELDQAYSRAAEEFPAPLIGDIGDDFRPYVVEFENPDNLYVEYWQKGNKESLFDIQSGDYRQIQTRYRAALRVDLSTGIIQAAGDSSQRSHEPLVERFLTEFNGSDQADRIYIQGSQIHDAKRNLALLTSLDEFLGDEAKLRFTRNQAENVEADPAHDQVNQQRENTKSNFQVFLGRTNNQWELVFPTEIDVATLESDEEITVNDIINAIDRSENSYESIMDLTLSLDSERSTYRIQKKAISPSTRRRAFQLLVDELNWTA